MPNYLKLSLIIVTTAIGLIVLLLAYVSHQLTASIIAGLLVLPLALAGLAACHNLLKLLVDHLTRPT